MARKGPRHQVGFVAKNGFNKARGLAGHIAAVRIHEDHDVGVRSQPRQTGQTSLPVAAARLFHHFGAATPGHGRGGVRAAVVDHHHPDKQRARQLIQYLGQRLFFIQGWDDEGNTGGRR